VPQDVQTPGIRKDGNEMPMKVAWEVSKAERNTSPMFVDAATADTLIKGGAKPITRYTHGGESIVGFDATEAAKAMTPVERREVLDGMVDNVISSLREMLSGRTRTLSGREARIARRIGAKPIEVLPSGEEVYRVADLDAATARLSKSELAGLELENWYLAGR